MSWILDIIVVLIISLTVYFAAKNGFVKTAISAFAFIIAIILTATLCAPVAEFIKQTPISDSIKAATEERISDIILDGSYEIDTLIDGKSEEFNSLLALAGMDNGDIAQWYDEVEIANEDATARMAEKIATPIVDTIALILAVIIIYVASRIALSIVAFVLDQVLRLPVLKSCNKLLGIILGVVLAFLRVCLFCFIVKILMENSAFLGSGLISNLSTEKTLLFKLFSGIDVFAFFI